MKLLYLHGLGSSPGGRKATFLQDQGFDVVTPALPDEDFAASVRIAQEAFDASPPDAVVGSSRGGAVALGIETGRTPVVLIAPAWRRWGTASTARPGTVILHSYNDEVVPFTWTLELMANSGLSPGALVEVGADHNMVDEPALAALLEAVRRAGGR
jgi:hypothetical protein